MQALRSRLENASAGKFLEISDGIYIANADRSYVFSANAALKRFKMSDEVEVEDIDTLDYVLSVPELDSLRDRVDFSRHRIEVTVSVFSQVFSPIVCPWHCCDIVFALISRCLAVYIAAPFPARSPPMQNLETETPQMTIGPCIFRGQHQYSIGTSVVFDALEQAASAARAAGAGRAMDVTKADPVVVAITRRAIVFTRVSGSLDELLRAAPGRKAGSAAAARPGAGSTSASSNAGPGAAAVTKP